MNLNRTLYQLCLLVTLFCSLISCRHNYQRWIPDPEAVENLLAANRGLDGDKAAIARRQKNADQYQATTFNAVQEIQEIQEIKLDRAGVSRDTQKFLDAIKIGAGEHLYHDLKIKGSGAGPGKLQREGTEEDRKEWENKRVDESPQSQQKYQVVAEKLIDPFSEVIANLAELNRLRIQTLYKGEHEAISNRYSKKNPAAPYIGLALSGGGIRSASFCGGVLRGLHERQLLDEFGYLSTVSGGGYVGGWYMTHGGKARNINIDGEKSTIPGSKRIFAPGSSDLRQLIQNGQYLIQGHFSDKTISIFKIASTHLLTLPFYALFDQIFDLDKNISLIKRYYRISIAKAFLYARAASAQIDYQGKVSTSSLFVDSDSIHQLARKSMHHLIPKAENQLPFWIINMHLSLKDDESPNYRNRSGDAFELTPLRAGADSIGYINVPRDISKWYSMFKSPSTYWMSPEFSVAISGAAADSKSFKQSGFLNGVLDALNINLGYFIDSWGKDWTGEHGTESGFCKDLRFYATANPISRFIPNSIPVLNILSAEELHDFNRTAKRYFLSDGGHFDNLGLYSLIRRGCRVIVIADGEQDSYVNRWDSNNNANKSKAFESLRALEEKLMTDFGVQIEFDWNNYEVPHASDDDPNVGGILNATKGGILIGKIKNLPLNLEHGLKDDSNGSLNRTQDPGVTILYIKSAYNPHKGVRKSTSYLDREIAETPEFPNESTANQWFSERKVLSYHQLGRELVLRNSETIREKIDHLKKQFRAPNQN